MPELPEVETIKLQLDQNLKDLTIAQIEILAPKSFIGKAKDVVGRKIVKVERRAKIILIQLADDWCLAIHLKLTGQLIFRPKNQLYNLIADQNGGPFTVAQLPNKFTRVIIEFKDGGKLYFNDLRKFGWIKVINAKDCSDLPELKKLGPEAINEKAFSFDYLQDILSKTKKPIKLILMDQEKIAGIGNIYANEALFAAGILPTRPANGLKKEEIKRLRDVIIRILKSAIAHLGTSDKDEAYRQISGEKGTHQNFLQVYGRQNQTCLNCSAKIKRIKLGGRGTFYCPKCQS